MTFFLYGLNTFPCAFIPDQQFFFSPNFLHVCYIKIYFEVLVNLRFPLFEFQVSDIFSDSPFRVFADTLQSGGVLKVLCVPSGAKSYSNTALKKGDLYNEAIKSGAKGLPFLKVLNDGEKVILF